MIKDMDNLDSASQNGIFSFTQKNKHPKTCIFICYINVRHISLLSFIFILNFHDWLNAFNLINWLFKQKKKKTQILKDFKFHPDYLEKNYEKQKVQCKNKSWTISLKQLHYYSVKRKKKTTNHSKRESLAYRLQFTFCFVWKIFFVFSLFSNDIEWFDRYSKCKKKNVVSSIIISLLALKYTYIKFWTVKIRNER